MLRKLGQTSFSRDFPGGPVVKTALPLQGAQVRSLVRELKSHLPRGAAKETLKKNKKKTSFSKAGRRISRTPGFLRESCQGCQNLGLVCGQDPRLRAQQF